MRPALLLFLALLAVTPGCDEEKPAPPRPVLTRSTDTGPDFGGEGPFGSFPDGGPTAYDPKCGPPRCTTLVQNLPVGHVGGLRITLKKDNALRDPITRWGDCLQQVTDCVDLDRPLPECVGAAAACPSICREAFAARMVAGDRPLDGFRTLFLDEGGTCFPRIPGRGVRP